MSHMSGLKAVDLFCGCGGMSAGLKMAGVEVIAGIDIESKYIATFARNFPQAQALVGDISKVRPEELMSRLKIKSGELDILVGGPPCQGFSKNVPRKFRYLEDPNNLLIKAFLDYCESLRPKLIIMENVAEMKKGFEDQYSKEVVERLRQVGYIVNSEVLNAANYGVPQQRRRAFFIANLQGVDIVMPQPTHVRTNIKDDSVSMQNLFGQRSHITVWEAIGDLPSVEHDAKFQSLAYATEPQNDYQERMRRHAEKLVTNHLPRKLKDKQLERLSSLKPGQGHKDLPEHLQVKSGYSGAYGRLTKMMVAPTITRWVFHPGSGRWGHPVDIRTLTIREAARIQSFPDVYEFVGSYNDQAGQLGNAVPPLLAKTVIENILKQVKI